MTLLDASSLEQINLVASMHGAVGTKVDSLYEHPFEPSSYNSACNERKSLWSFSEKDAAASIELN